MENIGNGRGFNALYAKIAKVQSALRATKDRTNSFGKYNYRSCEDILQAVKPLLFENGLILTLSDEIVEISGRFYIKAIAGIADVETGEGLRVTAYARESETKSGMDVAQITGSCSSYARKYALNGLFCIDDNKDIDSDEYAEQTQEKPKKATKKKTDSAGSGIVPRGTVDDLPEEIAVEPPFVSPVLCNDCGEEIKPTEKFTVERIVESSIKTFGVPCCMTCGAIRLKRLKVEKGKN